MKKIFTAVIILSIAVLSVQAQYYYKPYTYLQRHTDHPGHNPNNLNNDAELTFGTAGFPTGWTTIHNGGAAAPAWTPVKLLPFAFNFNGVPVDGFKVSTSGVLTFDTLTAINPPAYANVAIPSALIPNNSVMVWGLSAAGTNDKMMTKTFGTAPNRQFWVSFTSYSLPGLSTSCYSFWSIVFEETTNKIYVVDQRNTLSSSCTPTLTVGLQLNDSTAFSVANSPNVNDLAGKTPLVEDNIYYEFNYGTKPIADANLYSLTVEQYKTPPASVTVNGKIINYGSSNITSLDFKYDLFGTIYTRTITGLNIQPNAVYTLAHNVSVNVAAAGIYPLKVWVETAGDADQLNDTSNTATHGLSFSAAKKVLFEEGTGTWCGWCPRGTVYMDSLHNVHPSTAMLIAVHNGDPMTVTNYDAGMGYEIGGYPSGLVDRKTLDVDPSTFFTSYSQRIADKTPCDVDVTSSFDPGTRVITAIVHAHFATELRGDYRFNAAIVEDDVTGTTAAYNMTNYYSAYAPALIGGGHNWYTSPNPIPAAQMEYDHVGRAILGGWEGTAGSLPSVILDGSDQYYTYTYTLPAAYDINTVHVIGWVSDVVTGNIFNANRTIGSMVGIQNPGTLNFNVSVYPNPTESFTKLKLNLVKNAKVTVEVMDIMGRVIISNTQQNLAQGEYIYPLELGQFANGVYNVKVTVDNEQITTRILLEK